MTTKDEALRLALDMLFYVRSTSTADIVAVKGGEAVLKAIVTIQDALAQPESERNFCERCGKRCSPDPDHIHTCTPPAEQLTQEPVAWLERGAKSGEWFLAYFHNPEAETKPLYTSPQPAQKPLIESEQAFGARG